jgi:hypothetical protein
MRDGVVHTVGYLNNRQDPIKLGQVTEQDPTVSFLKLAQNIDIDDRGVATTMTRLPTFLRVQHSSN